MMEQAATLELLPEMESIAGQQTHVLKSNGKFGTHTVWLDPEFGYLPRKIIVDLLPGHLSGTTQLGVTRGNESLEERHRRFDNIKLEQKHGHFILTAYDAVKEEFKLIDNRREKTNVRTEFRVQAAEFDPTRWPHDAFRPTVAIPDGTPVRVRNSDRLLFWKAGKIE